MTAEKSLTYFLNGKMYTLIYRGKRSKNGITDYCPSCGEILERSWSAYRNGAYLSFYCSQICGENGIQGEEFNEARP